MPRNHDEDEKLKTVWSKNLDRCRGIRHQKVRSYASMLSLIRGGMDEELKKAIDAYAGGMVHVPYPKVAAYVSALIPNVLARNPVSRVTPRSMEDEDAGFAIAASKLLEYFASDNRRVEHARLVAMCAIASGLGGFRHCFDRVMKQSSVKYLPIETALWDVSAGPAPGELRWAGYEVTFTIEEARAIFKNDKLKPNGDFGEQASEFLTADWTSKLDGGAAEMPDAKKRGEGPCFTTAVVFERAGTPDDEDVCLDDDSVVLDERMGVDDWDGYSGKERKLILDAKTGEVLDIRPWGFILDPDELPITFLRPTIDPICLWGTAPIVPLRQMQIALTVSLSYNLTRMRREAAAVWALRKDGVKNADAVVKALQSGSDSIILEIDGMPGMKASDFLSRVEAGQLSPTMIQGMEMVNGVFNDVTNYEGLHSSDSPSTDGTATAATISEARKRTSVMNMAVAVDETMRMVCRKDLQIAMSRMDKKSVERRIGGEAGKYWPENPSMFDIRTVDVFVEPGSTRDGADQERAQQLLGISAKLSEMLAVLGNKGIVFPPEVEAKLALEPVRDAARLSGLLDFAAMVPSFAKQATQKPEPPPAPPMPPMAQPMMPPPAAEMQPPMPIPPEMPPEMPPQQDDPIAMAVAAAVAQGVPPDVAEMMVMKAVQEGQGGQGLRLVG
jgi:hypothetical protein